MGAQSTVTVNSGSSVVAVYSDSAAQFEDHLTIGGGTGSGYLDLTFLLDGSMSSTGTGTNYSQASLGVLDVENPYTSVNGGALSNGNLAIFDASSATTNTVDFYIQFDFDTPFTIQPSLYTYARYFKSADTAPYTATADFYSTATVTSARVYTSLGNLDSPLTTANIVSADGFEYGPNGLTVGGGLTTVPEPGTWLPVLLGLGLLGFAKGKFLRRKGARESA
ncbi:MAG: PEP-CTERM sorting domain-containing protein [Bryobacteraceae bacterium]